MNITDKCKECNVVENLWHYIKECDTVRPAWTWLRTILLYKFKKNIEFCSNFLEIIQITFQSKKDTNVWQFYIAAIYFFNVQMRTQNLDSFKNVLREKRWQKIKFGKGDVF